MWNPLIWILIFGFCSTHAAPIEEKAPIDSYGKLIQAKSTTDGKKIAQTDDGIEFEVPSYASGIVVPEPYNDLLPPLTSSEKLEAGSADSEIIYIENLGASSNNIRDGKSIGSYQKDSTAITTNSPIRGKTSVTVEESIEVPNIDLTPPYFDNEKRDSTDTLKLIASDENTEVVDIPLHDHNVYKGGFGGAPGILGNQESLGTYHQQKNSATDVNSALMIPPLLDDAYTNSDKLLYDGDIYKGGFGGLPGILGNQKSVGTYHQQKDVRTDINPELTGIIPPASVVSTEKKIQNSHELLYDNDIYKGGFGGPSGILGNQELIGTYYQMKTGVINVESSTTSPLSTTATNNVDSQFITPLEGTINESTDNSLYNTEIYKGGFGAPLGILGEQNAPGTFYQNESNEKVNKIMNENTTDIKRIQQTTTTIKPRNKIVSRFEFSSVQKPVSNIHMKKNEDKKNILISDDNSKFSASYNTNTEIKTSGSTSSKFVNPPSIDLLPPFADNIGVPESDKSLYDGDIYKGGFGGPPGVLGIQKMVGNYHQTKKPEPKSNDIKFAKYEDSTTQIYNTIVSAENASEIKSESIPSTDIIPPLVYSINNQETSTSDIITEENSDTNTKSPTLINTYFDTYQIPELIENTTPLSNMNPTSVSTKRSITTDASDQNTEKILYEGDIYKGGFGGSPGILGEQIELGTFHQAKNLENLNEGTISATTMAYNDKAVHIQKEEINTPDLTTSSNIRNTNLPAINTEQSLYEGDIYKGGFGGSAGFLGQQIALGTFHQEKNLEHMNNAEITATTMGYKDNKVFSQNEINETPNSTAASNIIKTNLPDRNLISDIPLIRVSLNNDATPVVHTKSFLSSPITTPTLSLQSTTPEPPSKFFTPPFFYPKPEEQTLFIQKGNVPSYSPFSEQSSPVLGQRSDNSGKNNFVFTDNTNSFSPPQKQETSIVSNIFKVPGPENSQIFPSQADNASPTLVNTYNNLESVVIPINLNSYGNIQGYKSPQFLSSTNTVSNNKFAGNFGGAPGVLGNQKQPGYVIQQQNAGTPSRIEQATATVASHNKYNGGFGGPPGILKPFDNKSK